jgi:hypothetical protein
MSRSAKAHGRSKSADQRRKHMKSVKMLGLAAVAAAALMAFVGVSSASATVLCKTPGTGSPTGTTCPAGWAYPAGTEIHGVSEGNIVFTTGSEFTEITCKAGTWKVSVKNEGSATETVKGETISPTDTAWGECSTPNGKCTVTTIRGGLLEVHWIEGTHNGTLAPFGFEITSSCNSIFGTIHCRLTTFTLGIGVVTGGATATADFENAPLANLPTSGLCPENSKFDAKYEITTPKPLYVTGHT